VIKNEKSLKKHAKKIFRGWFERGEKMFSNDFFHFSIIFFKDLILH